MRKMLAVMAVLCGLLCSYLIPNDLRLFAQFT